MLNKVNRHLDFPWVLDITTRREMKRTFLVTSGSFWGDTLKWCTLSSKHLRVNKKRSLPRLWKLKHKKTHSPQQKLDLHKWPRNGAAFLKVGLPNSERLWGTCSPVFWHSQPHPTFTWQRQGLYLAFFVLQAFFFRWKIFNQGLAETELPFIWCRDLLKGLIQEAEPRWKMAPTVSDTRIKPRLEGRPSRSGNQKTWSSAERQKETISSLTFSQTDPQSDFSGGWESSLRNYNGLENEH